MKKILAITILSIILLSVSFTSISALTPENEQKLNDKIKSLEKKIKDLLAENTKLKTENTKLKTENTKLKASTVKSKTENSQSTPTHDAWNQVVVLSSSTSKKTDTFKISGEKWKFTWSCKALNEFDGVNITVYKPNSDVPLELLLMQNCPPTPETTYVYKGTGEYYFDVMGANISGWTIKVEEFLK